MTQIDKELLHGLAAQAFNLAQKDLERGGFTILLAAYFEKERLQRLRRVEQLIKEKLGEDWLNDGDAKDAAFGMIRECVELLPPLAIVICTVINRFSPTPKLQTVPIEQQRQLWERGHDGHHEAVKQGLLTVEDALCVIAQTPETVCLYMKNLKGDEQPVVDWFEQAEFDGRLKMFGESRL